LTATRVKLFHPIDISLLALADFSLGRKSGLFFHLSLFRRRQCAFYPNSEEINIACANVVQIELLFFIETIFVPVFARRKRCPTAINYYKLLL
jgi:hypothetical protein